MTLLRTVWNLPSWSWAHLIMARLTFSAAPLFSKDLILYKRLWPLDRNLPPSCLPPQRWNAHKTSHTAFKWMRLKNWGGGCMVRGISPCSSYPWSWFCTTLRQTPLSPTDWEISRLPPHPPLLHPFPKLAPSSDSQSSEEGHRAKYGAEGLPWWSSG